MATEKTVSQIASIAKAASLQLAHLSVEIKNMVLEEMASALEAGCASILEANAKDLEFAQKNIRILSGLYGVLRPLDLIQPYRLEMGTKLSNTEGNNLYDYWGSGISEILNEDEEELIVNLASNEYFKAIDNKILKAQVLDIVFKEKKNDTYKVIGIYAKRARGLMINYIIRNRLTDAEALKDFSDEGYQYNQELSADSTWVYIRD